jgi:hypothetical protein
MDLDLAKMDEIVFGGRPASQGRAARADLEVSIVRSLVEEDIPALESAKALVAGPKPSGPSQLKSAHHQVARLLAEGREIVDTALITGYTPQYIHSLKQGGDFQELMKYYSVQREQIFVDTLERMRQLGITTLERLQVQLEDDACVWTKRELMEMAELMLLKPQVAAQRGQGQGGQPAGPGVVVNVKFISAGPQPELLDITPEGQGA